MRLTRRGRWVLTAILTMILLGLLALAAPSSLAAGTHGEAAVAVVLPGDSLWSIAARELPDMDPYTAVQRLKAANRLPAGYQIHPGQHLVLPVRS
ncbi:LysM peptidoglycan-binding domain-containing protein [Longispora albida]|uniref:LysM peptidoglycan-binding domain-containing protein n=1 Tax=Longispora albida TaxID=203523 RepID=UPI00036584CE|nr:LysM domain-containing protein [Longispora albida]